MEKILLKAEKRTKTGKKARQLRSKGLLPAVIYGHERKSEPIMVQYVDFKEVYRKALGSAIVSLKIGSDEESVLIHEVDTDPVTGNFRHADFYKVKLTEKIKTEVPLIFKGTSIAVKEKEGILVKNIAEIEVECLPTEIPKEIIVDISSIKTFDDVITLKDLPIPSGVKITAENLNDVVATATPPRSEEELKALEEEVVEDVEGVESVEKEEAEDVEVEDGKDKGGAKGKEDAEKKDTPSATADKNKESSKSDQPEKDSKGKK